jgi:IS30 family transposase
MPGPRLTFEERGAIRVHLRNGLGVREIALAIERDPATVSRELRRNASLSGYRPLAAQRMADARARRPKPFKLDLDPALRAAVWDGLRRRWSPRQVSRRLRMAHPGEPRWCVSPDAIYRSLYVQARGELRREVAAALRRGRTARRAGPERRGRIAGAVSVAERPPEADARRVPGHWEGDLLVGRGGSSQVGVLVERASRYVLLVPLPGGRTAPYVAGRLAEAVAGLPRHLWRSLTWDQGKEMAAHAAFSVATGIPVYFCDPASPWQRGTAESTNGLLRQYFPKGVTDFSAVPDDELEAVAVELNGRPRETLGFLTPAEVLAEHLVATAP